MNAEAFFLNTGKECDHIEERNDSEDIYEVVMALKEAMEKSNTDDPDVPPPSRKEALQAVATIQRCILTINHPVARELERILASFGRGTRPRRSR
jgi:hypothetical protein